MKNNKALPAIHFNGYKCQLTFGKYTNGRIAIELIDVAEPYERIIVATVNLPDEVLKDDEVAIKDYSENRGILDCLITAGIVSRLVRFVRSGYVKIPICRLLIKPEKFQ